jgi:hypothetical protein
MGHLEQTTGTPKLIVWNVERTPQQNGNFEFSNLTCPKHQNVTTVRNTPNNARTQQQIAASLKSFRKFMKK